MFLHQWMDSVKVWIEHICDRMHK